MKAAGTGNKHGRRGQGIAPVQVRLWFPPDVLAALDATAEEGYCSRSALAAELVRAGLSKARKSPSGVPADVSAIAGDRQRAVVAFRKRVLDGWRAVRALARRRGESLTDATHDYLQRIKNETGTTVGRRTLYRWDRLLMEAGIMGLVDDRFPAQANRQSLLRSVERPSKAVRKTTKPGCTHARHAS